MSAGPPVGDCLICDRIRMAQDGNNPFLIAEFDHTIFVVGDHQFHRGYSLVLLKDHVREPHELSPEIQSAHFAEVMRAGRAVNEAFHPWKLNYSCYGNGEPHVHWHIFPRREDDPNRTYPPWADWEQFDAHRIDEHEARELAARIAGFL